MKPVPGYEGYYSVTEDGRVYGHFYCSFLTPTKTSKGYMRVGLRQKGNVRKFFVHRLVAATYLGMDLFSQDLEVDHEDKDRSNNSVKNLRVLTHIDNIHYSLGKQDVINHAINSDLPSGCEFTPMNL